MSLDLVRARLARRAAEADEALAINPRRRIDTVEMVSEADAAKLALDRGVEIANQQVAP